MSLISIVTTANHHRLYAIIKFIRNCIAIQKGVSIIQKKYFHPILSILQLNNQNHWLNLSATSHTHSDIMVYTSLMRVNCGYILTTSVSIILILTIIDCRVLTLKNRIWNILFLYFIIEYFIHYTVFHNVNYFSDNFDDNLFISK